MKRKQRNDTWEVNPPRTIAEIIVSAAAVHGVRLGVEGRGGVPTLTHLDWVAAMSGSGDPLGEAACEIKILGVHGRFEKVAQALNLWGWGRWMEVGYKHEISAGLHRRMARMALQEFTVSRHLSRRERVQYLGIGEHRWGKLKHHYADLMTRLFNGEARVIQRVATNIR